MNSLSDRRRARKQRNQAIRKRGLWQFGIKTNENTEVIIQTNIWTEEKTNAAENLCEVKLWPEQSWNISSSFFSRKQSWKSDRFDTLEALLERPKDGWNKPFVDRMTKQIVSQLIIRRRRSTCRHDEPGFCKANSESLRAWLLFCVDGNPRRNRSAAFQPTPGDSWPKCYYFANFWISQTFWWK